MISIFLAKNGDLQKVKTAKSLDKAQQIGLELLRKGWGEVVLKDTSGNIVYRKGTGGSWKYSMQIGTPSLFGLPSKVPDTTYQVVDIPSLRQLILDSKQTQYKIFTGFVFVKDLTAVKAPFCVKELKGYKQAGKIQIPCLNCSFTGFVENSVPCAVPVDKTDAVVMRESFVFKRLSYTRGVETFEVLLA